jgi:NTE family protein
MLIPPIRRSNLYSWVGRRRPRVGNWCYAGGGAKGGAHVRRPQGAGAGCTCRSTASPAPAWVALVGAARLSLHRRHPWWAAATAFPRGSRTFVTGIDWKAVVGGVGRRDLETIEQKRAGVTYSNESSWASRMNGRVVVPAGIVNTSNIEDLLRSYVARARAQTDFDRLPIPYRAVATDMVSGKHGGARQRRPGDRHARQHGHSGRLRPGRDDKYILSDGGMVRNIPVDVARDLCADVVIVVNLVEEEVKREKLQTATQLLSRSTDVMIVANENLQLDSPQDRDIRIDVIMGDITTADFERVPETVPLGEQAALRRWPKLAPLSVPAAQYAAWRTQRHRGTEHRGAACGVKYMGMERVNPEYLERAHR